MKSCCAGIQLQRSCGEGLTPLKNNEPILVAITTLNLWHLTERMIENINGLCDPVHVVLVDDNSLDGTPEKARARGVTVISSKVRLASCIIPAKRLLVGMMNVAGLMVAVA